MSFYANRIKDTTTTTGTGTVTVSGAPPDGYVAFSTLPTGTEIEYTIHGGTEFEVGRGLMASGTTFTRDFVLDSSNSGALVNFSAGTKDVFVTLAAQSINTLGLTLSMPSALR